MGDTEWENDREERWLNDGCFFQYLRPPTIGVRPKERMTR